ncbi:membrane-spanning 4-domains subfamily A member 8-like [Tachyglossus aculeatus]|uniref:membrane-spanning 4-domains subfamily A member 8-like n=1 Tax=Tachyglossus aculeatus TaxID=9261 RepID=UPI0018F5838E|nr:membrane-spanning 4-domains subfamily A member 8-like [Tachyglossus aculeatus]
MASRPANSGGVGVAPKGGISQHRVESPMIFRTLPPEPEPEPGWPEKLMSTNLLPRFLEEHNQVFGSIQIMIGLIHIALGVILGKMTPGGYDSLSLRGGYPFWGGISFIISGSLSVHVVKHITPYMVIMSVGMNVISAIVTMIGIILFTTELIVNDSDLVSTPWGKIPGRGISIILLLFSVLEFAITCLASHFGLLPCTCNRNEGTTVISNAHAGNLPATSAPPEPVYSNMVNTFTLGAR